MRKWVVVTCLGVAIGGPVTVFARSGRIASARELLKAGFFQDFEELDLESLLGISELDVNVASRREEPLEEAPGVVSLLTGKDLKNLGARTLDEALRFVPGIDVRTDALGRPQVFVRGGPSGAVGGGSEGVVIMMNGQRIDDPLRGGATLLNPALPVDNIKKIEVLRGAASSLYGSGALGAVIDIVTWVPGEDFSGIEGTLEAGSFGTQRYSVRLGSEEKELRTFGFMQFENRNGPRLEVLADSQSPGASRAPGRALADLRALETNYQAHYHDWELGFRIGNSRTEGFVGPADALGDNDLAYRQIQFDASRHIPVAGGRLRATASYSANRYRELLQPLPPGFSTPSGSARAEYPGGVFLEQNLSSRRFGVEAVYGRAIGANHHLMAGAGLWRESASQTEVRSNYDFATGRPLDGVQDLEMGDEPSRGVLGAFASDCWRPTNRLSVTAGLRFDRLGDLSSVSPRVAASLALPRNAHLKLIYGRAFRAPTLAERGVSLPLFVASDALQSVRADSVEASLTWRRKNTQLLAAVYLSYVRDPIEPQGSFDPTRSRALANGPGFDSRGFEVELRRGFGVGNSAFVSYAFEHAEERFSGADVAGVPAHLGVAGATFDFNSRFNVTPTWSFRSSLARPDSDPRPRVAGYGLVGLTARALNLWRSLSVTLAASNLLDKRYFDPSPFGGVPGDYPRAGRRVLLSATYLF